MKFESSKPVAFVDLAVGTRSPARTCSSRVSVVIVRSNSWTTCSSRRSQPQNTIFEGIAGCFCASILHKFTHWDRSWNALHIAADRYDEQLLHLLEKLPQEDINSMLVQQSKPCLNTVCCCTTVCLTQCLTVFPASSHLCDETQY